MHWRGVARVCAVAVGCLWVAIGPAGAQQIVDVDMPYALPMFGGEVLADYSAYSDFLTDVALGLPKYFHRPFDDMTPRAGADAMAMGGAHLARPEGVTSISWNPAGLALMRQRSVAFDGFAHSSSGTVANEELPDTILIAGQPEFRITNYTDRQGSVSGFGFAAIAGPLVDVGGKPLVGGLGYRRYLDIAFGTETIFEMALVTGTGFPFVYGSDNRERGAVYAYTASLGYQPIETDRLALAVGASANVLNGRLRSEEQNRVNVRGFDAGRVHYQANYSGLSFELGAWLRVAEWVQLGACAGLPYDLEVSNSKYTALGLATPEAPFITRVHGRVADHDLQVPLFLSGGIAVGPIRGITAAFDINHRPWSETEIRYTGKQTIDLGAVQIPLSTFDGGYPLKDVTSYHAGIEFELPLMRASLHRHGMQLLTHAGYRTIPWSVPEVDLVDGEAPYYFGDQVEGSGVSFGLSFDTGIGVRFGTAFEFQSASYRKWFLDDTRDAEEREMFFTDPYARAVKVDRARTVFRFTTEMVF